MITASNEKTIPDRCRDGGEGRCASLRRMRRLVLIVAVLCLFPSQPATAGPALSASLGVAEEYNSNVNEVPGGDADLVTKVLPKAGFVHEAARLEARAQYSGSYNFYARGNREREFVHGLLASAELEAMENLLFLRVDETMEQVNRDLTQGPVAEGDTPAVQETRNTVTASPYFLLPLGRQVTMRTGYEFSNTSFLETDQWSTRNTLFGDLDWETTQRLTTSAGYSYSRVDNAGRGYDRHVGYAGGRYAYSDDSYLYLDAGPNLTVYQNETASRLYWKAGVRHVFSTVYVVGESSMDYVVDPVADTPSVERWAGLTVGKTFERSMLEGFGRYSIYDTDFQDDETYLGALGLRGSHRLTDRLTAKADLRWENHDAPQGDSRRWYAGAGLLYELWADLEAAVWYRLKKVDGDNGRDNYDVNRFWLQLNYTF